MYEFLIDFGTGQSFLGFQYKACRTIVNRNTLMDISLSSQVIYSFGLFFSIYAYLKAI